MRRVRAPAANAADGFSLLEMVVAIAILSLALGALYQAASGATRNVRADEKYAYGVELARSLLAANASVPANGINNSGETAGGFAWRVASSPVEREDGVASLNLHGIEVAVGWEDGGRQREVLLHSVVAGSRQQ